MMMRAILYRVSQFFAWFLFTLFFHIRVRGRRRIPKSGPFIVASNHQSYLDPIIIGFTCPHPVRYMARSSLFRNRLFRALIRSYGAFEIERDSADLGAIRSAVRLLKDGENLLLFPEATRTSDGSIGEVKPGVFLIARRAGVGVLPVFIYGAHKAWHRNSKFPRLFTSITVEYGTLFDASGGDYRLLADRLRLWFERRRERWSC